uniref:Uncharacterized protein n=1 Tax=Tetraselmis sp. GSL018 TaxID=582737 RepID=A0A061QQX1_9CHLO
MSTLIAPEPQQLQRERMGATRSKQNTSHKCGQSHKKHIDQKQIKTLEKTGTNQTVQA